jgi:pyridoxine 5-phosphate synthase
MTKLSVNINKIATLRNARRNVPDLLKVATDIQKFGQKELPFTLVLMSVIYDIKTLSRSKIRFTRYNIEGNPKNHS